MICIAENEAAAAATEITTQSHIGYSPITKTRLNSENSGKFLVKDVSVIKSFFCRRLSSVLLTIR